MVRKESRSRVVSSWHETDHQPCPLSCRYRGESGREPIIVKQALLTDSARTLSIRPLANISSKQHDGRSVAEVLREIFNKTHRGTAHGVDQRNCQRFLCRLRDWKGLGSLQDLLHSQRHFCSPG